MISVITPTLNEEDYIKAWCEFSTSISDNVVVADTGSTDGTLDIVRQYPIKILQFEIRSKYDWDEGFIRNCLLDEAKYDWILQLDADELLGDDFRRALPELMKTRHPFIRFLHYQFWLSPNLIRVKQLRRNSFKRFYPSHLHKMWKNIPSLRYDDNAKDHAQIMFKGVKRSARLMARTVPIPYFHYHHCIKRSGRQNRKREYYENGIKAMTYFGQHPKETRFYDWWEDSLLFPEK